MLTLNACGSVRGPWGQIMVFPLFFSPQNHFNFTQHYVTINMTSSVFSVFSWLSISRTVFKGHRSEPPPSLLLTRLFWSQSSVLPSLRFHIRKWELIVSTSQGWLEYYVQLYMHMGCWDIWGCWELYMGMLGILHGMIHVWNTRRSLASDEEEEGEGKRVAFCT